MLEMCLSCVVTETLLGIAITEVLGAALGHIILTVVEQAITASEHSIGVDLGQLISGQKTDSLV